MHRGYIASGIEVDAKLLAQKMRGFVKVIAAYNQDIIDRTEKQTSLFREVAKPQVVVLSQIVERFQLTDENSILDELHQLYRHYNLSQENRGQSFHGNLTRGQSARFAALVNQTYSDSRPADFIARRHATDRAHEVMLNFIETAALHARGSFGCGVELRELMAVLFHHGEAQRTGRGLDKVVQFPFDRK